MLVLQSCMIAIVWHRARERRAPDRYGSGMVANSALALIASAMLIPSMVAADSQAPLIGTAHVIDGDTLDLVGHARRIRVRLNAIDAPEAKQTCQGAVAEPFACGAEARAALRDRIEGQPVRCDPHYPD